MTSRRFPSESRIHFLECSGNPEYKKPYGKTASDLVGLLSCAEMDRGQPETRFAGSGLQPGAKWVVAEGADAAAMTRSIPIEKCLDDAMLVHSQNGERLRPQQGYPLRLLLPGFEGNMNIKWLRRPARRRRAHLFARGNLEIYRPDAGRFGARVHVLHGSESIITRPSGGQRLNAPGFSRNQRHRLERPRQDQPRRRLGR